MLLMKWSKGCVKFKSTTIYAIAVVTNPGEKNNVSTSSLKNLALLVGMLLVVPGWISDQHL